MDNKNQEPHREQPYNVTHVHPSKAWEYIALMIVGMLTSVFIWFGGVFLISQAEYSNPGRFISESLFFFTAFLLLVMMIKYVGWDFFDRYLIYREKALEAEVDKARFLALRGDALVEGSRSINTGGDDEVFDKILAQVLIKAYETLEISNEGDPNKPIKMAWSRGAVNRMKLTNGQKPSSTLYQEIQSYLVKANFIEGDPQNGRINVKKYPTLAIAQKKLIYNPVIIRKEPILLPQTNNWSIIE